jgi:Xaa-Pro aminopeptidase
MRESQLDLLLVTPSPALTYLTGARLDRSERLIALIMDGDGRCRALGPAFEASRITAAGLPGELSLWEETEDPIPRLASLLAAASSTPRLALEGTTPLDLLAPLSRRLPSARISSATSILAPQRMRKEPEEIDLIQSAVNLTLAAIRRVMESAKEGQSEKDLLAAATDFVASTGARLEGLVQFGPDSAVPHAGSGDRKLLGSDVILMDLGVEVHGYRSDISRTFGFGRPPARFPQVYALVKGAQEEGFRAARTGVSAGGVDEVARAVIRKSGFGRYFTHRLGHGIGLEGHEPPYLVGGNELLLEPGMVVTVEPGIYLPGEFGVRLEDDVLITETGPRILSRPESA